ncbi:MAG: Barrier-to-autointegration factor [Marteilia pararefringens]
MVEGNKNISEAPIAVKTSTSLKHQNFLSEPMGEKLITSVPGIGPKYGELLSKDGYDKAYVLLGQFLVLKKDKKSFYENFLMEEYKMSKQHAEACYESFLAYADQHI